MTATATAFTARKAPATLRWLTLDTPEGPSYVDPLMVCAIGPSMEHAKGDGVIKMRALYLVGGQCLVILDISDNMQQLFETHGAIS